MREHFVERAKELEAEGNAVMSRVVQEMKSGDPIPECLLDIDRRIKRNALHVMEWSASLGVIDSSFDATLRVIQGGPQRN